MKLQSPKTSVAITRSLYIFKSDHRASYTANLAGSICDRACENRPCERKKSPIFSVFAVAIYQLNKYLYHCNKIFITTAEFNGFSSAAYGGIRNEGY